MVNFTQCYATFVQGMNSTYAPYVYHGHVYGAISKTNTPPLITYAGCKALCGTSPQYYDWATSSGTITTWVLPLLGLILQAPFASNESLNTFFAFARWIGSPISSIAYVLWNIHVTRKCALMVDMASKYHDNPPEDSEFADVRDAMYILAVMNQYTFRANLPRVEAERLLRYALFSKDLSPMQAEAQDISGLRKKLARDIRRTRRKGAIPVFISLGWFYFSLAISIQSAFGQLGNNTVAHDLAIGLLTCWLPVFVLSSIVDRNPVANDDTRQRLNDLVSFTRDALLLSNSKDHTWVEPEEFGKDFFIDFAGQGRKRWHYGVAHPILAGIEDRFAVRQTRRNWLMKNPKEARKILVQEDGDGYGLLWFDFREVWQILAAFCIVFGSVMGAFTVSFFTPTVGLGCRSGSYTIFMVTAAISFFGEMIVWAKVSNKIAVDDALATDRKQRGSITTAALRLTRSLTSTANQHLIPSSLHQQILTPISVWWASHTSQYLVQHLFLIPLDIGNTAWLTWTIIAQTFGLFQRCICISSIWSPVIGGYVNFETMQYYRNHGVIIYWAIGTALSCTVLIVASVYLVIQWATQSHLSSEDYQKAARGLRRTQTFKRYTVWLCIARNSVIELVKRCFLCVVDRLAGGRIKRDHTRRSLVWCWKADDDIIIYGEEPGASASLESFERTETLNSQGEGESVEMTELERWRFERQRSV